MGDVIKLHTTSAENVIAQLPPPDDLAEIVCMYRRKSGGTQWAMSEMKIETLAYYILELQREYAKVQCEAGY